LIRAASNSFPALLLFASYLWGGCISCEQFFMLPGSKSDCCHRDKCNKAPKQSKPERPLQDCQTMPLEQISGAHSFAELAIALAGVAIDNDAGVQDFQASAISPDPVPASPPDLPILNATLLI